MMAIRVAPSKGIAVCRPIAVIASILSFPAFKSTNMPSIITMALSTSIPIASTKAASIVPPANCRKRNDPKTVTTKLMPIIRPLLNPIASISINTTMTTDSIRLMTNVPSESPTRSG